MVRVNNALATQKLRGTVNKQRRSSTRASVSPSDQWLSSNRRFKLRLPRVRHFRFNEIALPKFFADPQLETANDYCFDLMELSFPQKSTFLRLFPLVQRLDPPSRVRLKKLWDFLFCGRYESISVDSCIVWSWLAAWFIYKGRLRHTGQTSSRRKANDELVCVYNYDTWTLMDEGERKLARLDIH